MSRKQHRLAPWLFPRRYFAAPPFRNKSGDLFRLEAAALRVRMLGFSAKQAGHSVGGICLGYEMTEIAHVLRHVRHFAVGQRGSLFRRGGSQEGASLCKAPSWVAFLLHASLANQRSMAAGGSSEHASAPTVSDESPFQTPHQSALRLTASPQGEAFPGGPQGAALRTKL